MDSPRGSAPPAEVDAPAGRSLGYIPALDGLRGIAVVAVVVFHARGDVLPGGFLGVSLFFTLSGYLICSLLLAERERSGSVDFVAFWARRFRRLSPAAFVVVAVCVAIPLLWDGAWGSHIPTADVATTVASVANVAQIHLVDVAAANQTLPLRILGPLGPYWSLAVEEQFYLAISLLFLAVGAARAGRRALWITLSGVAVASVIVGFVVSGQNVRWLFATDIRAVELAAGCLLALWCTRASRGRAPVVGIGFRDGVGWAAAALTVVAYFSIEEGSRFVERGLFGVAALVNVGVLVGALAGGSFSTALSWRPLVELGKVSYSWYLVHWPVILILRQGRLGLGGAALTVVQVLVGLALAVVLAALVERPIRSGRRLRPPAFAVAWVAVAAGVVMAAWLVERVNV